MPNLPIRNLFLVWANSEASFLVKLRSSMFQVIHNYGHGGSGITLCWGCAKDVEQIFNQIKFESGNIRSNL